MQKKTKSSLADQAYTAIKKDIITCTLEPGAQIAQSSLVESYSLGITPVREALKRLEMEGLVESIPRFGYVISPITIEDVKSIYELRLLLEIPAAKLAVERATDAQLKTIGERAHITYDYQDQDSYLEFLGYNVEFHTNIAMTTGNIRLANTISGLLEEMTRIFHLGLEWRDSANEMRYEHIALNEALTKRDVKAAQEITEDQIKRSQFRVLEMLTQQNLVSSQTTFSRTR